MSKKPEKIKCQHCSKIIGIKYIDNFAYCNSIVKPNKYGIITKVKIRGTRERSIYDKNIGYFLETQLNCSFCKKNTIVVTKTVISID